MLSIGRLKVPGLQLRDVAFKSTQKGGASDLISHLHKHRFDVSELELPGVVLLQCMELHRRDPIGLDGVVAAGKEGLHIADKGARDRGRQF